MPSPTSLLSHDLASKLNPPAGPGRQAYPIVALRGLQAVLCHAALVILILLTGSTALLATSLPAGRVSLRSYTKEDGLPSPSIRSCVQGTDGLMWFASEGGLFWYDGHRFKVMGKEQGFTAPFARTVGLDGDGGIWASWRSSLFRGVGESFVEVPFPKGIGISRIQRLPGARVLVTDEMGQLFIAESGKDPVPLLLPDGGKCLHSCTSLEGTIWATVGAVIHERKPDGTWRTWGPAEGLRIAERGEKIATVVLDDLGRVWARSLHHLFYLAPGDAAWKDEGARIAPSEMGFQFAKGRGDRLWLTTREGLACRMAGQWSTIRPAQGLSPTPIHFLYEDQEGSLWTRSGTLRRMLGHGAWRNHSEAEGLLGAAAWALHEDRQGQYWVGTEQGLFHSGTTRWERAPGTFASSVSGFVEAKDGTLFAFTGAPPTLFIRKPGATAFVAQPIEGDFGTFQPSMVLDREGFLWLVSNSHGIWKGQEKNGRWSFHQEILPGGSANERFFRIQIDSLGRLWTGSHLGITVRENGVWRRFTEKDGLLNNEVAILQVMEDGHFWSCSLKSTKAQKGVYENGQIRILTVIDLSDYTKTSAIYILAEDPEGRLWIGTSSGIHLFDRGQVTNFDRGEGLAGEDCISNQVILGKKGDLWVGTFDGLTHLASRILPPPPAPPKVRFSSLRLGGQPVDMSSSPRVSHDQGLLEVQFSALTYLNERRVQHQVRLLGYDKDWVEAENRDYRANYLAAGSYTLETRARIERGPWGPISAFQFEVRPALWNTWWARTSYVLVGLSILVLIERLRHRHLSRRNIQLERMVEDRTLQWKEANQQLKAASEAQSVFFAGMSHDLRTPLNAIILYSELRMGEALDQHDAQAIEDLSRIQSSGRHLLSLINDILDLAKLRASKLSIQRETVAIAPLLEEVGMSLRPLFEQNRNRLELLPCLPGLALFSDPIRVKQILINLLGNAAKFTRDGRITLSARSDQGWARLEVSDSGIGMTPEQLDKIFNPFEQASDLTERTYGGTGLGLTLSRQLAELMGGRLEARSELGQGSTFSLILPLLPET